MSKSLSEPIRSHKDLDKDSAPHYHKAVKFYEALSKQLVHQGHVLDVFACALDQVLTTLDCMLDKKKYVFSYSVFFRNNFDQYIVKKLFFSLRMFFLISQKAFDT